MAPSVSERAPEVYPEPPTTLTPPHSPLADENPLEAALSIGLATFMSTSALILLKLLVTKTFSVPTLNFGGRGPQLLSLAQGVLVTPGVVALITVGAVLLGRFYARLVGEGSLGSILTASLAGIAGAIAMVPVLGREADSTRMPLVILIPILLGIAALVCHQSRLVTRGVLFSACLPGALFAYSLASLLDSEGITAAFPLNSELARQGVAALGGLLIGHLVAFLLPTVIGVLLLSGWGQQWAWRSLLAFGLMGAAAWMVLILDNILEPLLAFPGLFDFRFAIELLAILMGAAGVGLLLSRGRAQAGAAGVAIALALAAVPLPITPKAAMYSSGMAIDVWVRRSYSEVFDRDGDGASTLFGEGDCDDHNAAIRPGRPDVPFNGIDENCLAGDLQQADVPPNRWQITHPASANHSILLVTVDTLRSDIVFGANGTMPRLRSFAQRHGGFDNAHALGGATAFGLLNLFYTEEISPYALPRHRNLPSYMKEAGYRTLCIYPTYRAASVDVPTTIFQECDLAEVVAGDDKARIPSGQEVIERALLRMNQIAGNKFVWIQLDDLHDYVVYRPGKGYKSYYLFDGLSSLGSYQTLRSYLLAKYRERAAYLDRVLDEQILSRFENDPAFADTLLILTGDHGEEFLEHGGIFHGSTLYEELTRVPIVFSDGQAGEIYHHPMAHQDAVKSMMAYAGFERFPEPATTLRTPPSDDRVLVGLMVSNGLFSVRRGRYKLILNFFTGAEMLFDLVDDPGETRDRSGDLPQVAAEFRTLADIEERRIIKR